MTHRANVLFRGEAVSKREIDAMVDIAVMTGKLKSLILPKFGQHIEVTDWIIGIVIYIRGEGSWYGITNAIVHFRLSDNFSDERLAVLGDIMNNVAKIPFHRGFCAAGWVTTCAPPVGHFVNDELPTAEEAALIAGQDTSAGDISKGPMSWAFRDGGAFSTLGPGNR